MNQNNLSLSIIKSTPYSTKLPSEVNSPTNSPTRHRGNQKVLQSLKSQKILNDYENKNNKLAPLNQINQQLQQQQQNKDQNQKYHNIRQSIDFHQLQYQRSIPIKCQYKKFHKQYKFSSQNTEDQGDEQIKQFRHEKDIKKKLDTSFDMKIEDAQQKETVGENVIQSYYNHYKKLDKIIEQNKLTSTEESAYTALLNRSETNKVLPSKMGIIKHQGDDSIVKLNNHRYGDKYIDMLSEGSRVAQQLQFFYLANNRITEKGANTLLQQITKNAKVINLAQNQIGKLGCDHLIRAFKYNKTQIEELNLESNNLGDNIVKGLLESLLNNRILKKLNLSKNYLTDNVADNIRDLLQKNFSIQELYLHWNLLKNKGGNEIFESLVDNTTLRVLDLSWNNLGLQDGKQESKDNSSCAIKIAECLKQNESLIHVDLSCNNFTLTESKTIAEGLQTNQSLYGFHFYGNYGYVDPKGFLIIEENTSRNLRVLHEKQNRIDGVKSLHFKRETNQILQDCCWICEGWQEHTFLWTPELSGEANRRPIFIHLDYQGYEYRYMGKKKKETKDFRYNIMVPQGQLIYFFTAMQEQQFAQDQETIEVSNPVIKGIKFFDQVQDFNIKQRNILDFTKNKPVIDYNYIPQYQIKPRTPDQIYNPPKSKPQKRKWTFPISIFASYQKDSEELLRRCFETDWSLNKIEKITSKDPEDMIKTKELLWSVYKQYKDCYKYYSAFNPVGRVFAIQQFAFSEFIKASGVVDGALIQNEKITLKWEAAKASQVKNSENSPKLGLVRHQFMECLVRIADEKYIQTKTCSNYYDAVKQILEESFNQELFKEKYNSQLWRDTRYWNEQCDDVLKLYKIPLESIFKKYYGGEAKPGQPKFMSLDELNKLIKDANCYESEINFQERDTYVAYNQAMMTQVDEINSKRTQEMNFVEYLEAIARIADKFSSAPFGEDTSTISYEKRFANPLWIKLESFCFLLFNSLADSNIKATFKVPSQSLFAQQEDLGQGESSDED